MGHNREEECKDLEQWPESLCLFLVGKFGQFGLFGQLQVAVGDSRGLFVFAAEDSRGCWDLDGLGLQFDLFGWVDYKVLIECCYFAGLNGQWFDWFLHQLDFDCWVANFHYWKLYSMWNWSYLNDCQKNYWKNYLQYWHYCYDQQCLRWQCW